MNTENLTKILEKHARDMPLHSFLEIINEWQEMRDELVKSNYIIVTSLRLLGFTNSGYPTKQIDGLTDEDKNVLAMMTHIHAGASCGIPGLELCLKSWRDKFPIDKNKVQHIDSLFAIIKN